MLLPKELKSKLEKSSFYMRIRYNALVQKIWLLIRADVRKENNAKRKFYLDIIPRNCKLIFDIGANEGMLTEIFSMHSEQVIAIEPSARNLSILKAKFYINKSITMLPAAVSNFNGDQLWYEDTNDYATGTLSPKWNEIKQQNKPQISAPATLIKTVTLDSLLQQFSLPDYIKIDVEGNELQVIKGLSQAVPLLSFEAILPQFFDETVQCIELLSSLAISTFNYSIDNKLCFNEFKSKEILLIDIKELQVTIDIFCRMH